MSSSVNSVSGSSTSIPIYEIGNSKREDIVLQIDNSPPTHLLLKEVELLKKHDEAKDKLLQSAYHQINTLNKCIEHQNSDQESYKIKLTKKSEELEERDQTIADQESEIATLKRQLTTDEREISNLRRQNVNVVPIESPSSPRESTSQIGDNVQTETSNPSHGRFQRVRIFFRRYRRLIEAGIGLTGAVLAVVFPEVGIPILLGYGVVCALLEFGTGRVE